MLAYTSSPGSGQPSDPSFQTTDCALTITSFSRGTLASMAAILEDGIKNSLRQFTFDRPFFCRRERPFQVASRRARRSCPALHVARGGLSPLGVSAGVSDGVTISGHIVGSKSDEDTTGARLPARVRDPDRNRIKKNGAHAEPRFSVVASSISEVSCGQAQPGSDAPSSTRSQILRRPATRLR